MFRVVVYDFRIFVLGHTLELIDDAGRRVGLLSRVLPEDPGWQMSHPPSIPGHLALKMQVKIQSSYLFKNWFFFFVRQRKIWFPSFMIFLCLICSTHINFRVWFKSLIKSKYCQIYNTRDLHLYLDHIVTVIDVIMSKPEKFICKNQTTDWMNFRTWRSVLTCFCYGNRCIINVTLRTKEAKSSWSYWFLDFRVYWTCY